MGLKVEMPFFCILFSCPHFPFYSSKVFGHHISSPSFHIGAGNEPLASLHILNNRLPEPYWWYMHDYKHFEQPVVVMHNEEHRPPRNLSIE
jgi:hypothetical protein